MEYLSSYYPIGENFTNVGGGVVSQPTHTRGGKIQPLGRMTKSASSLDKQGLENAKIKRLERYTLQDISSKLLPKERVSKCLKHRINKDTGVFVKYNPERQQAHYANIMRCGSVWTCPVCSAQIAEKRRLELQSGIAEWRKRGGAVYLLTLTNRHHVGDNLQALLAGQSKALKYLWSDRKPKEMMKALGKCHQITATEVTYGDNGWHPHFHILLFMRHEINIQGLRSFIAIQWQHSCKKAGLKLPNLTDGVDLQDGTYADKYVAKWGLEDEMTKGHTKKGREGGLTPFDLLRQSVECPEYGKLFQTFANAFKGKRQLSWSKGAKADLCIEEKSDEELAEETEKQAIQVKEIPLETWELIRRYSHRAEYLECVELDILDKGNRADSLEIKLLEYEISKIVERSNTN